MKTQKNLSPLRKVYLLTERASKFGFDWEDLHSVLGKLEEEINEFKEALSTKNKVKVLEEIGDLFFVLVNVARFLKIDPEEALENTIKKFNSRFRYIEKSLKKSGKNFYQSNLKEMDQLWEEAKIAKNLK